MVANSPALIAAAVILALVLYAQPLSAALIGPGLLVAGYFASRSGDPNTRSYAQAAAATGIVVTLYMLCTILLTVAAG